MLLYPVKKCILDFPIYHWHWKFLNYILKQFLMYLIIDYLKSFLKVSYIIIYMIILKILKFLIFFFFFFEIFFFFFFYKIIKIF